MDEAATGKFTLNEYVEYLKAPQYVLEGCETEAEYEAQYCGKVMDWYRQSQSKSQAMRSVWDTCYKALTAPSIKTAQASPTFEDNISAARIPIVKCEALQEVSALYASDYIPALTPLRDEIKPMTTLGNMYLSQEFKINGWRSMKFTLGIDGFCTDRWIVKTNTSDEQPGLFGQDKRITINRVDPRNFYWDMEAPSHNWSDVDYYIVKEDMDMGVCRSKFKDKAAAITEALTEPAKDKNRKFSNSQLVMLPGQQSSTDGGSERRRVNVMECWFHDERYRFEAEKYEDVDGDTKIRMNDDGYVVGDWVPAYPHGRMIVIAAERVVLRDIPNPFWHQQAPFSICHMSPDLGDTISVGKAADLLGIERRINDFETRVHSYGQAEIERPMQADVGALPSNIQWYRTTGQSRAILLKNAGKAFVRPLPVEIPQFVAPYLQRMDGYTQKITGRPAIMTGQIAEGANLSAEAVQSVQGFGASVMGMEAIFIAETLRNIGFQVFELVRQTYPENISATIMLPTGEQEVIQWNSKELNNGYFLDVDLASNAPGGKSAANNFVLNLYDKGLVDDIFALQNLGIDGWQDIHNRKKQDAEQKIYSQAAGRAAGLQIKSITKNTEKPGAAPKL